MTIGSWLSVAVLVVSLPYWLPRAVVAVRTSWAPDLLGCAPDQAARIVDLVARHRGEPASWA